MTEKYNPETYWSQIATRITNREGRNIIAGDDEPYYRYKRSKFLKLLSTVDFNEKNILELGAGPGGNIEYILSNFKPKSITDADISSKMLEIASKNVKSNIASFVKIDGEHLPFEDKKFDVSFTATVLQHNTDERMLKQIISELCRVSNEKIVIFEKIEPQVKGTDLCLGRPVNYYADIFKKHGFKLIETEFINLKISYYVSGAARKLLNAKSREEGEPLSKISILAQKITLPLTTILDNIFASRRGIGKLVFVRKG